MSDVTGEALLHNFSQQWSNVGHAEQVSFDQLCARNSLENVTNNLCHKFYKKSVKGDRRKGN